MTECINPMRSSEATVNPTYYGQPVLKHTYLNRRLRKPVNVILRIM